MAENENGAAAEAKAPKAKKAAKKAVKKVANAKKAKKASKAPKRKPMPNGKSVHASEETREPKWNDRRKAVVKALRQLKATDADSARTAEEIAARAAKCGAPEVAKRVDFVKIICDVYRTNELVHNGFIKSDRPEGSRELRYYLTAKGQKTTFPEA